MQAIEGVSLEFGAEEKIREALKALEADPAAPRELTVKLTLHVHQEYPKHVAGVVVNSAEEEAALAQAPAPKPTLVPAPEPTAQEQNDPEVE